MYEVLGLLGVCLDETAGIDPDLCLSFPEIALVEGNFRLLLATGGGTADVLFTLLPVNDLVGVVLVTSGLCCLFSPLSESVSRELEGLVGGNEFSDLSSS